MKQTKLFQKQLSVKTTIKMIMKTNNNMIEENSVLSILLAKANEIEINRRKRMGVLRQHEN